MPRLFKKISLIFLVLVLFAWVYYIYRITAPVVPGASVSRAEGIDFLISKGETAGEISANLHQAGLIRDRFWFEFYVWLIHAQADFAAGRHQLYPGLNVKQIVDVLTNASAAEDAITVIEGWTIKEVAAYLEEKGLVSSAEFLSEALSNASVYSSEFVFLQDKPAHASLEGYLFPDTYRVFNTATAPEIIYKMLANFDQKLTPELRAEIARQNKTVFDIVILASLLEKEVQTPEDMKLVADIFYKRLKIGQGLQSDATINYLTGKGRARSSAEDLEIDSPYNTYKYAGLPPGPLANPGLNAILAAIYPQANAYYYFLTVPDGTVIYAQTYAEHLNNQRKYLTD